MLKQPPEVITTYLNKNIICNIFTDKISRKNINDEGDDSSLQTNNMSNIQLVKDNVKISETVHKSMNHNNHVSKEQSNNYTFDSAINESELSRKYDIITSNNNKSLLNYHETDNNNEYELTSNYLIFDNIGLLNYGKRNEMKWQNQIIGQNKIMLLFCLT